MTVAQHIIAVLVAGLIGEFVLVLTGFLPRPDHPDEPPRNVGRGLAWAVPVAVAVYAESLVFTPRLSEGVKASTMTVTFVLLLLVGLGLFAVSLALLRMRERPSSLSLS